MRPVPLTRRAAVSFRLIAAAALRGSASAAQAAELARVEVISTRPASASAIGGSVPIAALAPCRNSRSRSAVTTGRSALA